MQPYKYGECCTQYTLLLRPPQLLLFLATLPLWVLFNAPCCVMCMYAGAGHAKIVRRPHVIMRPTVLPGPLVP